jgi:hypothetical protein
MSRRRTILVGAVAMLSLLGIGGTVQAETSHEPSSVSATRWCC